MNTATSAWYETIIGVPGHPFSFNLAAELRPPPALYITGSSYPQSPFATAGVSHAYAKNALPFGPDAASLLNIGAYFLRMISFTKPLSLDVVRSL
jgi:hypothetical protein